MSEKDKGKTDICRHGVDRLTDDCDMCDIRDVLPLMRNTYEEVLLLPFNTRTTGGDSRMADVQHSDVRPLQSTDRSLT